MTREQLTFTIRVNKARHDKDFQFFLALSGFGENVEAHDNGQIVRGLLWRGVMYVTHVVGPVPKPPVPPGN